MTGDDRRSGLIDVALREFAEHGVEATSMKMLAQKAGVSSALFYHYFRSKEELLTLAIQRDSMAPQLAEMVDLERPATEMLPQLVDRMEAHLLERRHLVWLILSASRTHAAVAERLVAEEKAVVGLLSTYLEARVRAGELRPHDSCMAASTMTSLLLMPYVTPSKSTGQLRWFVELMLAELRAD